MAILMQGSKEIRCTSICEAREAIRANPSLYIKYEARELEARQMADLDKQVSRPRCKFIVLINKQVAEIRYTRTAALFDKAIYECATCLPVTIRTETL